jgi:hypothetical protein
LSDLIVANTPQPVAELDRWFDQQLAELEKQHEQFITKNSLKRNLRG